MLRRRRRRAAGELDHADAVARASVVGVAPDGEVPVGHPHRVLIDTPRAHSGVRANGRPLHLALVRRELPGPKVAKKGR